MKMLGYALAVLLAAILVTGLAGWIFAVHEADSLAVPKSGSALNETDRGAVYFEGAAFSGLSMAAMESHALPWRLAAAALVLDEVATSSEATISLQSLNTILARFGFLVDAEPSNRPTGAKLKDRLLPLGFTYSNIAPIGGSKLLVANLGCAACHAGVTYNTDGHPQPDKAWLGMPNTSINLEAYVQAVFVALRNQIEDPDNLIGASQTIFSDMDWREVLTLRWLVLPVVRDRIAALENSARALPFPNGVPGATNGVAALKYSLNLPLFDGGNGDNGIVSVPELGGRAFRSSLLADGAYAPPGKERQRTIHYADVNDGHLDALAEITTFFTIPSMGVHPAAASKHRDVAADIFAFLAKEYKPQPFPASIDLEQARLGADLYKSECSACHGDYDWSGSEPKLISFPNWIGNVDTDTLRARTFTNELAEAIADTGYSDSIDAVPTGQYVAPPLTGIWASAPYLHNGSVPTIGALLDPRQRPQRFMVGGHALDFERMGIALGKEGEYAADYEPFSVPVWYDTKRPGQGNKGHSFGSQLNAAEKRNLIEFMKLL